MDGEAESGEFPDWELLHNSNSNSEDFPSHSHAHALIRSDHFSLDPNNNSSSNSSHSSTDPSEVDRNFDDSYVAGEIYAIKESSDKDRVGLQIWNDDNDKSSEGESSEMDSKEVMGVESTSEEEKEGEKEKEEVKEEEEERRMVWWKVPFEVFKYWVVRVSPVWSFSVAAAAFVGLVILGRRLYKMKRKTQNFKLKLALDDNKKVSQFMGRVARLNEAFSVVRRVPIIRPSLPASNVTLRPVMSMR